MATTNPPTITEFDRRLLSAAQRGVPLVPRPYAALAVQLETDERTVVERIHALRAGAEPVIRTICGLFESGAVGYATALAACAAPPDALDRAGQTVAKHPGVSHCYGRSGRLNLWFTLSLGPESRLGLDGTARVLSERIGAGAMHVLPTLKRYKLGVHVGASGRMESRLDEQRVERASPVDLSDEEKSGITGLQQNLLAKVEPFEPIARGVNMSVERLLGIAAGLLDRGVMRRYAAVLHHRRAGLATNVLVAWRAGAAGADAAGQTAAEEPGVSHCYLRPAAEDWPYTLYTMVHGRTREECGLIVDEIAARTGLGEHVKLWTLAEYKKAHVRYFTDALAEWESRA